MSAAVRPEIVWTTVSSTRWPAPEVHTDVRGDAVPPHAAQCALEGVEKIQAHVARAVDGDVPKCLDRSDAAHAAARRAQG